MNNKVIKTKKKPDGLGQGCLEQVDRFLTAIQQNYGLLQNYHGLQKGKHANLDIIPDFSSNIDFLSFTYSYYCNTIIASVTESR